MEKHAAVLDAGKDPVVPRAKATTPPDVTVIVISTNEGELLDACLTSVLQSVDVTFECLVFNNASRDNTAALMRDKFTDERITCLTNQRKLGFIENNNIGLRRAKGRYVLLLNPDTRVHPDTLSTMVHFMDIHPKGAVATCRLTYRDGTPQANVRRFPTPLTYFYRITMLDKLFPDHDVVKRYLLEDLNLSYTQDVDWFITAFFFMRRSIVDEIGPLDEKLMQPFYCEDLEWCYRSKLHGYRNYYVADASIVHDYQQTSRKKIGKLTFVHVCNILRFYQKHGRSMLAKKVASV